MLQDSIKKCVKLVTSDLQKATSDIKAISPGPSPLSKQNNMNSSTSVNTSTKVQRSPAARQLFPPSSAKGGTPKAGIGPVSNSFLKGISLLKSSQLPTVTPYSKASPNVPPTAAANKQPIAGFQTPSTSKQGNQGNAVTAQILANQRMSSDSASVVRVTKNASNDPVIIDVEATTRSTPTSSSLQLTKPRSIPVPSIPSVLSGYTAPKLTSPQILGRNKPILTVGQTNASALKSLVNKVSKRHKFPSKSPLEVVVIDDANRPAPQPIMTISTPTANIVTTSPPRKSTAPTLTTPQSSPIQINSPSPIQISSSSPTFLPSSIQGADETMSPVLSTLGLQPSSRKTETSLSTISPLSHDPPIVGSIPTDPESSTSSRDRTPSNTPDSSQPSNGPKSPVSITSDDQIATQETHSSIENEPEAEVKQESVPSDPLEISCGRCDIADEKFTIPENAEATQTVVTDEEKEPGKNDPIPSQSSNTENSSQETPKTKQDQEPEVSKEDSQSDSIPQPESTKDSQNQELSTTDSDFPAEIFAPDHASNEEGKKESVMKNPTTSLSAALHAASDALLEN